MGFLSNRVDKSKIKPGDHIHSYRTAFTYSHHAGWYQIGKYANDIGVRTDVNKVAVEDLAVHLKKNPW